MRTEATGRLTLLLAAVAAGGLVLLSLVAACLAGEPPLVEEHVDEIAVVETPEVCRVVFIRDRRVLAARRMRDVMLWTRRDGAFRLIWNDGGEAQRVVSAPRFSLHVLDVDPFSEPALPWWAMQRNMRDLRQP